MHANWGERGVVVDETRLMLASAAEAPAAVADPEQTTAEQWAGAAALWLASRKSENTRRAYRAAWEALLKFTGKAPWLIRTSDVERWAQSLRLAGEPYTGKVLLGGHVYHHPACRMAHTGMPTETAPDVAEKLGFRACAACARMLCGTGPLSEASINQMLAAISSFYSFCNRNYPIERDGREVPLFTGQNPVNAVIKRRVKAFGRREFPTSDEVRRIFAAIPMDRPQGLRDMALLLGMFITTRRVSEWVNLRWGDIHEGETGRWFEITQKGGKTHRQKLPGELWRLMVRYLKAVGRYPLWERDFIFVALRDTATRLPHMVDYDREAQPLSPRQVNELLKRYGRKADVAEEKLHSHGLRHAGARLRRQKGADVYELKEILGHSSIAITEIYSRAVLDEPEDARAADVFAEIASRQMKLMAE